MLGHFSQMMFNYEDAFMKQKLSLSPWFLYIY